MKTLILLILVIFSCKVYSQDTVKIKQVDSLVYLINHSNFQTQRDTIKQDQPQLGISGRTYLTMVNNGNELKKYVNSFYMASAQNGVTKQMNGENAFYFDRNKLIKVEEFAADGDKKLQIQWYYADDKPIYNTLKSDQGKERAEMLLTIAKGMVEKLKQIPKTNASPLPGASVPLSGSTEQK